MKALFIIGGFGKGSLHRSQDIIKKLNLRNTHSYIDVISAHKPDKSNYIQNSFQQKRLTYNPSETNLLKAFIQILFQLVFVIQNSITQVKIIFKNHYDTIYIDSDYSLLFWFLFYRGNLISINTSPFTIKEPFNFNFQYLCEFFEYYFYKATTYQTIVPIFFLDNSDHLDYKEKNYNYIPMLEEVIAPESSYVEKISLTYLTGGTDYNLHQEILPILKRMNHFVVNIVGIEDKSFDHITYHGKIERNEALKICQSSHILLIHGGFSSVNESLTLSKPTLCIPLPNHFEQNTNANYAAKNLDWFINTNILSIEEDLNLLTKKYYSLKRIN